MGHDNRPLKVAANGRLSIPARQRQALGLERGGMVVATVQDGELRIRPVQAVLDDLAARVAPYRAAAGDSVERFLTDRRLDAEQEAMELDRSSPATATDPSG